MTATTLSKMKPMSQSALEKAQTEDMDFHIEKMDKGSGEIIVTNHDSDSEYTIQVRGNNVMCDCPAKQYHCDVNEQCKHEIRYGIVAP